MKNQIENARKKDQTAQATHSCCTEAPKPRDEPASDSKCGCADKSANSAPKTSSCCK